MKSFSRIYFRQLFWLSEVSCSCHQKILLFGYTIQAEDITANSKVKKDNSSFSELGTKKHSRDAPLSLQRHTERHPDASCQGNNQEIQCLTQLEVCKTSNTSDKKPMLDTCEMRLLNGIGLPDFEKRSINYSSAISVTY